METPKIFESDYRFCLILWAHEPISASSLAKLCLDQLGWKRTTTYTVIKRLADRGVLSNDNSMIVSLITKEQVQASDINELVDKRFGGSVPTFIAAFAKHQDLSDADLDEMQRMIDLIRSGGSL